MRSAHRPTRVRYKRGERKRCIIFKDLEAEAEVRSGARRWRSGGGEALTGGIYFSKVKKERLLTESRARVKP